MLCITLLTSTNINQNVSNYFTFLLIIISFNHLRSLLCKPNILSHTHPHAHHPNLISGKTLYRRVRRLAPNHWGCIDMDKYLRLEFTDPSPSYKGYVTVWTRRTCNFRKSVNDRTGGDRKSPNRNTLSGMPCLSCSRFPKRGLSLSNGQSSCANWIVARQTQLAVKVVSESRGIESGLVRWCLDRDIAGDRYK